MPALFTLPKQVPLSSAGLLLPGAKLYFYQTGTTTDQAVYQDVGLSAAHTNPVVADAAGVFAAIYLGQFTTNYRVRLETSAGVLLWQLDGIPADSQDAFLDQSNTFTASGNGNPALLFSAAIPNIAWYETDGTANQRRFQVGLNAGVLAIAGSNDAANAFADAIQITLGAGPTITSVNLKGTVNQSNGIDIATVETGTFTGTGTGFSGAWAPTCSWTKIKKPGGRGIVHLTIPATLATSNAATWTITGLPAAIAPADGFVHHVIVRDNGVDAAGVVFLTTGAPTVLTFGLGVAAGGFTASGSKGLSSQAITLSYATTA